MAEAFDNELYKYLREYDEWDIYADHTERKRCGACGEMNSIEDMELQRDVQNYVCRECLQNEDYPAAKPFIIPLNYKLL